MINSYEFLTKANSNGWTLTIILFDKDRIQIGQPLVDSERTYSSKEEAIASGHEKIKHLMKKKP